ncbi:hypothetical protein MVEN_02151400 [Mycena venus]|uniref:Uncharacterized protein n=1 Tax=Mycena venus TaxID=2733690 RepID=A0A8H7CGS9_9AGAR|nr:hypothetical protein MVEN_02151400 [Mycena venus]
MLSFLERLSRKVTGVHLRALARVAINDNTAMVVRRQPSSRRCTHFSDPSKAAASRLSPRGATPPGRSSQRPVLYLHYADSRLWMSSHCVHLPPLSSAAALTKMPSRSIPAFPLNPPILHRVIDRSPSQLKSSNRRRFSNHEVHTKGATPSHRRTLHVLNFAALHTTAAPIHIISTILTRDLRVSRAAIQS